MAALAGANGGGVGAIVGVGVEVGLVDGGLFEAEVVVVVDELLVELVLVEVDGVLEVLPVEAR